jgi:hypothetical protein
MGNLDYCIGDNRCKDGMILMQAFVWNTGTCRHDDKGNRQVDKTTRENTNAWHRGGITRSSEETL